MIFVRVKAVDYFDPAPQILWIKLTGPRIVNRFCGSTSSPDKYRQACRCEFMHGEPEALEASLGHRIPAWNEPDMTSTQKGTQLTFGEMTREVHHVTQVKCRDLLSERTDPRATTNDC